MRTLLALVLLSISTSCMTTHGCVSKASRNKKVMERRHRYRKNHRTYNRTYYSQFNILTNHNTVGS